MISQSFTNHCQEWQYDGISDTSYNAYKIPSIIYDYVKDIQIFLTLLAFPE